MTGLSPAAQAVLAAIESQDGESDVAVAAAALRAVADQVVPIDRRPWWLCNIRRDLLAIAAELEAQQ